MNAFCISAVKKLPDSRASDPLTSPPNTQFYLWPHNKQIQSHQAHRTHNTHSVPARSLNHFTSEYPKNVLFVISLAGEEQTKQVISHQRTDGSYPQQSCVWGFSTHRWWEKKKRKGRWSFPLLAFHRTFCFQKYSTEKMLIKKKKNDYTFMICRHAVLVSDLFKIYLLWKAEISFWHTFWSCGWYDEWNLC